MVTPEPDGRRTPHLGKTHMPEQMSPCISMPRLFTSAPGVWSRVDLGTLLCLALDVGSVVEAQLQPCVEHTWRPFSPHCSFQSLVGISSIIGLYTGEDPVVDILVPVR
jgi:hypothetical protein